MAIRVGRGEVAPAAEGAGGVLRGTPRGGRTRFEGTSAIPLGLAMTRPPPADAATRPAVAATVVPTEIGRTGRAGRAGTTAPSALGLKAARYRRAFLASMTDDSERM